MGLYSSAALKPNPESELSGRLANSKVLGPAPVSDSVKLG